MVNTILRNTILVATLLLSLTTATAQEFQTGEYHDTEGRRVTVVKKPEGYFVRLTKGVEAPAKATVLENGDLVLYLNSDKTQKSAAQQLGEVFGAKSKKDIDQQLTIRIRIKAGTLVDNVLTSDEESIYIRNDLKPLAGKDLTKAPKSVKTNAIRLIEKLHKSVDAEQNGLKLKATDTPEAVIDEAEDLIGSSNDEEFPFYVVLLFFLLPLLAKLRSRNLEGLFSFLDKKGAHELTHDQKKTILNNLFKLTEEINDVTYRGAFGLSNGLKDSATRLDAIKYYGGLMAYTTFNLLTLNSLKKRDEIIDSFSYERDALRQIAKARGIEFEALATEMINDQNVDDASNAAGLAITLFGMNSASALGTKGTQALVTQTILTTNLHVARFAARQVARSTYRKDAEAKKELKNFVLERALDVGMDLGVNKVTAFAKNTPYKLSGVRGTTNKVTELVGEVVAPREFIGKPQATKNVLNYVERKTAKKDKRRDS